MGARSLDDEYKKLWLKSTPEERQWLDEYNREIDEAVKRVEAGEYYTHEEVVAMFTKKWTDAKQKDQMG